MPCRGACSFASALAGVTRKEYNLRIRQALSRNDLAFLFPLLLGIVGALLFFTRVVPLPALIVSHPELIYGLFFGLIVASIVNIFLASPALHFAISVLGVLIFAGLTAWDTQRLKNEYDIIAGNSAAMARATIMGALSLYLNFINMFMFLLQLFGNRE